jgi:pimeloyl-ACP methyl ester carboxylesterase
MAETHSLALDDVTVRWLEQGEGLPVVLVHGLPTSPLLWRHVLPRLRRSRALAFEMIGYGESIPEGRGEDIGLGRQARHLLDWLDALGIRRCVLAGHDLGGGVVQIAATHDPDRCAGLFLVNSVYDDSWPIPSVRLMRSVRGLLRHLPRPVFRSVLSSFIRDGHDDADVADESIQVHWRPYARHEGAAAFERQIHSLDNSDTRTVADRLGSLGVPARVLWGVADDYQRVDVGERLAEALGVDLVREEAGKHFVPEDHPDVVARGLNALVREAEPPRRRGVGRRRARAPVAGGRRPLSRVVRAGP